MYTQRQPDHQPEKGVDKQAQIRSASEVSPPAIELVGIGKVDLEDSLRKEHDYCGEATKHRQSEKEPTENARRRRIKESLPEDADEPRVFSNARKDCLAE